MQQSLVHIFAMKAWKYLNIHPVDIQRMFGLSTFFGSSLSNSSGVPGPDPAKQLQTRMLLTPCFSFFLLTKHYVALALALALSLALAFPLALALSTFVT